MSVNHTLICYIASTWSSATKLTLPIIGCVHSTGIHLATNSFHTSHLGNFMCGIRRTALPLQRNPFICRSVMKMTIQSHYLYSLVLYPSDCLCSECTRPSAFGCMCSSLFAMSSCLCVRYSHLTVIYCLLAWIHLIRERCNICYLLPVFSVTPFSTCGLPGCVYWWVVCLRVGSCNFHVCSPFLLLVSIIITSSRQLNSGLYSDVACSFSINLNRVISAQSPYGNLPHHSHWDHAASVTSE